MKRIVTVDYDALSREAAKIVASMLRRQPRCVLGLATGSTPLGLYRELAAMHREDGLDFSQATSFNLDEYLGLSPADPNSYRYFMEENLFSRINIPPERTHIPDGSAPDPAAECARYEAAIEAAGGIHLQVLGLGHNGHIGFNEPAEAFAPATQVVELDERTIQANARFFGGREAVPRRAITMGIGTIMRAERVLLLVSGEDKREILRRALRGPVTPAVPASVLQQHPNLTVITDMEES